MTNKIPKQTFILIIISMILLASNMRVPIVTLGSMAIEVQEALSINQTQLGWLGSIPVIMFATSAFISPKLIKKFGVINILVFAIALLSFGIGFRVLIVNWWVFLVGTVILSLAIGFINTLSSPAIKLLTPHKIPLVTGIVGFTMSIVSALAAGIVLPISKFVGWQWALGGWSILSLFALFCWLYLNKTLKTDSVVESSTSNTSIPMWKTPMAWFIAVFMGCQSLMFYTFASFLPSILISRGLSDVVAGQMATIFLLSAPFGIVVLTWLMRHRGIIPYIAIFSASCNVIGVTGVIYFSVNTSWLWLATAGFGGSLLFTLASMLIPLRTYNSEQAGDLSGMVQTIGYCIAFIGPIGTGWLHELTNSWQLPLNILLSLMVINLIFSYLASRPMMIDGKIIKHID